MREYHSLILKSYSIILIFIDNSRQASIKVNETQSTNATNNYGAVCKPGSECLVISYCNTIDFSPETRLPCGSEKGGTLLACCPVRKASSLKQTMETSTTGSTASPSATTIAPITTASNINDTDVWAKLPEEYREKAKLLPPDCGWGGLVNRVSDGKNAGLGQFPWITLLGYNINGTIHYFCGGTLISDKYVLTAAHCTNASSHIPTIARFGEWNISDTDRMSCKDIDCALPVVDIEIEHIIIHDGFGDSKLPSFQNDIALLRLKHEVKYTELISPICLGPDIYESSDTRYIICGWGLTEKNPDIPNPVLQYADIPSYDFNTCDKIAPAQYRPLAKTQFCAGGDTASSCKGDSGGPLTYISLKNFRTFQKGIISLGTSLDCDTEGRPNIFTEVSAYILWILDNIKK